MADGFATQAEAFLRLHLQTDAQAYGENLETRLAFVGAGAERWPVSVGTEAPDNAWVVSLYTTYCRYASEETRRLVPRRWQAPLLWLIARVSALLARAQLDRAATLNNWLLSTNLYPPLDARVLQTHLQEALQRWPQHAIWLRSLNGTEHPDWLAQLRKMGFSLIGSRQVYLYADIAQAARRHGNLHRDLRLLQRRDLGRAGNHDIGESDYARIAALYAQLYLHKYSPLNPRYNERFMRDWHRAGLLEFSGLRDGGGELVAIVGTFSVDGLITAPVVGYDTRLPPALGLYRWLMAAVFDQARRRGHRINLSAGAGRFKALRGGVAAIEYSAVYARHLPLRRRAALTLLAAATRWIGVPLMRRYEL